MTDGFVEDDSIAGSRFIDINRELSYEKESSCCSYNGHDCFFLLGICCHGTVNFTGSITDVACTIDTTSQNQDVDLGTIAVSAFPAAGSLAAAKIFTLVLKDCPDTVTGATVRFDGTQVPGDNNILALTAGTDTAGGIGVQISDDQNKVVPLYQDSSVYTLVSTAPNNLNFSARYISLTDDVTAGEANAVTQFTVIYQ